MMQCYRFFLFSIFCIFLWSCSSSEDDSADFDLISVDGQMLFDHYSLDPCPHILLENEAYLSCYDVDGQIPVWVYYEITYEELNGSVKRTNRFIEDSRIKGERAEKSDYKGSGYDRGHMFPAAAAKYSKEAMVSSFLFTNITPQTPKVNRGLWKKEEAKIRKLVRLCRCSAYVVTGVTYDRFSGRIGDGVVVPDYLYKFYMIDAILYDFKIKNVF